MISSGMGQLLVRQIDDDVLAALKERAAAEGKPLERLAREVLGEAARPTRADVMAKLAKLRASGTPSDMDLVAAIRAGRDDEFDEGYALAPDAI